MLSELRANYLIYLTLASALIGIASALYIGIEESDFKSKPVLLLSASIFVFFMSTVMYFTSAKDARFESCMDTTILNYTECRIFADMSEAQRVLVLRLDEIIAPKYAQ